MEDFDREVDGLFDDTADGALAGAPSEAGDDGASGSNKRQRGSGGGMGRISIAVRVYDISAYAGSLFVANDRRRMEKTTNGPALVPRPQSMLESSEFRTLLTLPLRSDITPLVYHDAFVNRIAIFDVDTMLDAQRDVDVKSINESEFAAMAELEDEHFRLTRPYGLVRVATSLPNALVCLRNWATRLGGDAGAAQTHWFQSSTYIDTGAGCFASPRDVATFTMTMSHVSLDGFLALPLPLPTSCEDLIRTAEMQIALWNCTKVPVVYEIVRGMNTLRPGLMRENLTQGLIAELTTRYGPDFVDGTQPAPGTRRERPAPSRTAIFNLLVKAVMPVRRLHKNVFYLNTHVTKWRKMLITPKSVPWESLSIRQLSLRALRDMHAAGVDEDLVSRAVIDAMDANLHPEHDGSINMSAELANFRTVFGMTEWSDLNHGADFIAKMCMHLKMVTGTKETWLELFIVMLAVSASASLRFGKIHICLLGPAACGKSMIIEWAQKLAWPLLTRSAVYESAAASRATDSSRESRQGRLAEESAGVGYFTTPEQRAVCISVASEVVTRHRVIAMNKDAPNPKKQRVLVETEVWDCSSQIMATNVPPNRLDPAAASRYSIRTMSTQPYPSQAYIEAHNASQQVAVMSGGSQESTRRAIRFFTLLMASVFTLDTVGATELPEYPVSIAILNAIMPSTTDAGQVRRSKRLDRMTHVLAAWCGMSKFLLSPFSPLTLIYNDVLSLEALMRMPDFMSVSCAPGIFVASLSPLMHDDLFLRTIINILCTIVFKPSNSKMHHALAVYKEEYRRLRIHPSFVDVSAAERAERVLLLRHICRLFPLGPNLLLTNHQDCVVFSIRTLEQYAANSGTESAASTGGGGRLDHEPQLQSAGFSGARMMADSRGGRDATGQLCMMNVDSMDGFGPAVAVAAAASGAAEGTQQQQQQLNMANHFAASYDMLSGSAITTAMEALADAIFPVLSTSVYSNVNMPKRRNKTTEVVKSEILEVLGRLQIKCLANGMYATHWRNLMIEDEGAALQKIENFTSEFDVPGGTYVVAQVVHPHPRAEALNVVKVEDNPQRKALDTLMNLNSGRADPFIAALTSNVSITPEVRSKMLDSLDPTLRLQDPTSWFNDHLKTMWNTGLVSARSPACRRVLQIYNSRKTKRDSQVMLDLMCRPAFHAVCCRRRHRRRRC